MSKRILLFVALLITSNIALGATGIVEWDNPTQREDGTSLPLSEIAYTKVIWGTCGMDGASIISITGSINVPSPNNSVEIQNIAAGTYCFGATSVDTENQESVLSNVVSKSFNKSRPKGPRMKGVR